MKVFVILLLGLQVFLIGAASTNLSLNELSANLNKRCESYCQTLMQSEDQPEKDNKIKELEAKIAELQADLAVLDEKKNEYEQKIKLDDELVAQISSRMDNMKNKVQQIAQIHSDKKHKQMEIEAKI